MQKIPSAWKRFLLMYLCFAVFTTFTGTFMSSFLLRATGSQQKVMLFNIALAIVQPFIMLAAVKLIRLKTPLFSQSVGLGIYAAVFLWLGIAGESAVDVILLIGALISAANGFFYVTYALQLQAYTDNENRDACYGLQSLAGGILGLVLPAAVGLLLGAFTSFTGYRIMFLTGLLFALSAVVCALRLPPVTNVTPEVKLKQALRVILYEKSALAAMFSSMAGGFYSGTAAFFLSMLLYEIVEKEAVIGACTTCQHLAAILSAAVYTRCVRPENRRRSVWLAVGIMLLLTLVLMVKLNAVTLFGYSVILSAVSPFFLNPPLTGYVTVIERLEGLKGLAGEVHALREFWYGSGRVLGILLTMLLMNLSHGAAAVLMAIIAVQLVSALLMKKMEAEG